MKSHLLRRRITLVLVGLAVLFVLGCGKESTPLRVGLNMWPGYEFLYLAQEKGYYKEAGLDVKLVNFTSLPDARRAYEHGQIDILGATVVEVLQTHDLSARSPEIVRVIDYSNGADVILARPGIKNGAGLRGKRIGVELGSLGIYILARGLAKSGLGLADVKAISMDQLSMEEAYRKGELDAVVTYPPASIKLLKENKAVQVFSSAEISGEVVDVIAAEASMNSQRHEEMAKFLAAYNRAVEYSKTNPDDAYRIMAAREGISAAEFKEALTEGMHLLSAAEQAEYFKTGGKLREVIDVTDRILRETSQIKGADRRAASINPSFVATAQSP